LIKVFTFIIILLHPFIVFAKPIIDTKIVHYDIFPNSKNDLERALFAKTPIVIKGRRYLGITNWDVRLNYDTLKSKNSCSATNLKTVAKIIIILPRISKEHKVNYSTKSSFRKFYNKVKKHEHKHEYYTIQAAKEIDKKVQNIKPQNSCKKLKSKFDKVVGRVIKKYDKKNKDFDAKTRKGYNKKSNLDSYL